jgi:hypothetical protein
MYRHNICGWHSLKACHNKRIHSNKVFKDLTQRGKSTMDCFLGFKLHLVCNEKGELLNFSLTKGNVDDRNPDVINVLNKDLFGKLYAYDRTFKASFYT